ncbi:S41 family peptidase [Pedobacter psychrodurus]|uniref:S41 family peptidase n=1 Tax=Pedobacter psychrodurus TaxID=2530456 RepID=UPI00292F1246|nr:S41 family peptidase [Pedobacter psychrodurus]
MKNILKSSVYILLLVTVCYQAKAQPINETEKYFLFFKTWNFLKYYHPKFTKGKEDADAIFMKKQSLLDHIHRKAELNTFLMEMVTDLGNDAENLKNGDLPVLKMGSFHQWYMNNVLINTELKNKLMGVYKHRDTVGKHYVPALNYTAEIPNERKYKFPDSINLPLGMRLLALAKLQGVIDYLYPHKTLMDESWDQTVKNNILLFKNCASRMDYEVLLLKIVAKLNDTHAYNRFYDNLTYKKEIFKNSYYPPFDYQIIDNKILVTGIIVPDLCAEAGIKAGDLITAINGIAVNKKIDGLKGLLSASNRNTLIFKLNNYLTNLMWSNDSSRYRLAVSSSGKKKELLVAFVTSKNRNGIQAINNYMTAKLKIKENILPFKVMDDGIAYFNIDKIRGLLDHVQEDHLDAKMDSILNLAAKQKGMIFDMRGYPSWGGFVFHYIYKKFAMQHNLFGQYFQADATNLGSFSSIPGTFTYYPDGVKAESFRYTGKVCIIVNSDTQSLSEWNTMNLQYTFPNAITIGEQTAGADGDEKCINIPGNYNIYFTGNAIYYPDGTLAQGKGVKINKIIKPKIEDILADRDTQLNFAIKSVQ